MKCSAQLNCAQPKWLFRHDLQYCAHDLTALQPDRDARRLLDQPPLRGVPRGRLCGLGRPRHEGWTPVERTLDLRVGGVEILHGRFPGNGVETLFTARYHLVEAGARLVYVYDMHLSGRHHSVSVASVEFIGDPEGTRLRFTEQVTFVDGTDGRDGTLSRKRGTAAHLERIAAVL
jgi:uncharacterized protein YndB with AHSA1/START domain